LFRRSYKPSQKQVCDTLSARGNHLQGSFAVELANGPTTKKVCQTLHALNVSCPPRISRAFSSASCRDVFRGNSGSRRAGTLERVGSGDPRCGEAGIVPKRLVTQYRQLPRTKRKKHLQGPGFSFFIECPNGPTTTGKICQISHALNASCSPCVRTAVASCALVFSECGEPGLEVLVPEKLRTIPKIGVTNYQREESTYKILSP